MTATGHQIDRGVVFGPAVSDMTATGRFYYKCCSYITGCKWL